MTKQIRFFVLAAILMSFSRLASANCDQNTGHVDYISYFGAQPFFALVEFPGNNYTFDPNFTPEQRRIVLNLLQIAITTGKTVQVMCNTTTNPPNVSGISVRTN